MGKVNRLFCIDYEYNEELKKINASELINELLTEHFSTKNKQNTAKIREILSKKGQEMKILKREIKHLKEDLRGLEDKEKKIIAFARGYPQKVVEFVMNRKSVTELFSLARNGIMIEKKNYPYSELRKLYNQLKGGNLK